MMIDGEWVKTGHALVLDASHDRNCHPWFVLAQEWHTKDEETIMRYDTEYIRPPQKVEVGDKEALGVLPGTSNRTPIAPLKHWGRKDDTQKSKKFFENFGENFSFDLERMGKKRGSAPQTPWRPDLCEIMMWHWDAKRNQEVCYNKAGIEYIVYNPATRQYAGPGLPSADEIGSIIEDALPSEDTGRGPVERFNRMNLESSGTSSGSGPSQSRGHGKGHDPRASGTSSAY